MCLVLIIMALEDVDLEEIIQIVEGRRDLTPTQYLEARKTWFDKILQDKDLEKELILKFIDYRNAQVKLNEFVISVHKHDFE